MIKEISNTSTVISKDINKTGYARIADLVELPEDKPQEQVAAKKNDSNLKDKLHDAFFPQMQP